MRCHLAIVTQSRTVMFITKNVGNEPVLDSSDHSSKRPCRPHEGYKVVLANQMTHTSLKVLYRYWQDHVFVNHPISVSLFRPRKTVDLTPIRRKEGSAKTTGEVRDLRSSTWEKCLRRVHSQKSRGAEQT